MKPFYVLTATIAFALSTMSFNAQADRAYVSIGGGNALDYVYTYRTGKKNGKDIKPLKTDKGVFKAATSVALGGEGSWWRSTIRHTSYSSDIVSRSLSFQFDYLIRTNNDLALFFGPSLGIYTLDVSGENSGIKENPWLFGGSAGATYYFNRKVAVSLRGDANFSSFVAKSKEVSASDNYTQEPLISTYAFLLSLDFLI